MGRGPQHSLAHPGAGRVCESVLCWEGAVTCAALLRATEARIVFACISPACMRVTNETTVSSLSLPPGVIFPQSRVRKVKVFLAPETALACFCCNTSALPLGTPDCGSEAMLFAWKTWEVRADPLGTGSKQRTDKIRRLGGKTLGAVTCGTDNERVVEVSLVKNGSAGTETQRSLVLWSA